MSFVAVAIGGGAVLGGAVSLFGASKQADAAKEAAAQQAAASHEANMLQKQMYDQTRDDQAPWRQAGSQALSQMGDPYFQQNFSMSDFQQDPGYQFRMNEGQKALERSAAARGGLMSGGTMKAISQYGQDYASNEYQNAYNRFNTDQNQRFNRLASIAGVGQTANSQVNAAGTNYANNVGNNLTSTASAMGAAGIAGANAWSGAASNIGSSLSNLGGNWMTYSMMNRNPSGGSYPPSYGGFNYNSDNTSGFKMPNSSGLMSNYSGE